MPPSVDPFPRTPVPPARKISGAESDAVDRWFVDEVLPHEAILMSVIRRAGRNREEASDLRQEVYARVYESARAGRPDSALAFVLTTARNLLIDRARRAQVVSIEAIADLDDLPLHCDELTPERHASGRQDVQSLVTVIGQLPPRCREVIALRKLHGLSQREVASTLGIAEDTVEKQISKGMRLLADLLLSRGIDLDEWTGRKRRNRRT